MAFSGWKRMLGRKSRFENAAASESTASHKESVLQSKQTPKRTYFENSVPDTPSISNAESSKQEVFPLRQEHESPRSKSSSAQNYPESSAPSQTTLTSQLENHISHLTLKIESSAPAPRIDSLAEYRHTGSTTESTEVSRLRQLTAPLGTSSETTSTIKDQLSTSVTLNHSDSDESYASAQSDDSDASDDSTILRQRESIRQQKITPPQEECKLALAKALEATDKVLANKLADKLASLLEGNHEKMPELWNIDLAKLALSANCLPRPDIITYLSTIGKGGVYQGRTVSPNLQIEALFIEGVIFLKVQNYTKAIKSFKRGYKLARQAAVPGQASDFIKILLTTYEISGGPSEEVEVYTALLPKNYQPTPLFLLELQHLTATNVAESVMSERCFKALIGLSKSKRYRESAVTRHQCNLIFALLSIAQGPISVETIEQFCDIPAEKIVEILDLCEQILKIERDSVARSRNQVNTGENQFAEIAVSLGNPYFRKIFTEPSQVENSYFLEDSAEIHRRLSVRLFERMDQSLKDDICNLRAYGTRQPIDAQIVHNCIPTSLQYACKNWLYHLQEGGISPAVSQKAQDFLVIDSLRWIEAMGVMQSSSLALFMIRELERIYDNKNPKVVHADSEIIIGQIKYICKLLEQYNPIIDETPLQIHYLNLFLRFEQHLPPVWGNLNVDVKIHDLEDQVSVAKRLESEFQEFRKIGHFPKSGGLETRGESPILIFSPDCQRLAYNKPNAEVVIVKDLAIKDSSTMLITGEKSIWGICFSHEHGPLSNTLALATPVSTLLWDLTKNKRIRSTGLDMMFGEYVWSSNVIEFSPNNKCLGVLANSRAFVLDAHTGSIHYSVKMDYIFLAFAFSCNSEYAVALDNRSALHKISSTSRMSEIIRFPQTDEYSDSGRHKLSLVQCFPNETVLAWHCWDTVARGVTTDGKPVFSFKDIQFQASLAVSRSQRRFAIVSRDSIIIGNIPKGEQVQCLRPTKNSYDNYGKIFAAAFFPSGDFLITVSSDYGLKCHELILDLKVEDRWVVRGNEPLLWIPPSYHATIVSPSKSNCVLFTHQSGYSIEISFTLGRHEMLVQNGWFPGTGNNTSTRERPPPVDPFTLPPLMVSFPVQHKTYNATRQSLTPRDQPLIRRTSDYVE